MHNDHTILEKIKDKGLLPLYFHPDPEVCTSVMRALYLAGIRVIEFTNRGEQALENFSLMRRLKEAEMPDLIIGIGTVKTAEQARQFIAEGADFLISPGVVPEIAKVAAQHNHYWVPGAMTPTEIISAEHLGARFVKLFPGQLLGPAFVSAVKELFPRVAFMPTGGAEPVKANLEGWFKSGVAGVGMGSKLITPAVLAAKNYEELTLHTRHVLELIREIRN